MDEGGHLGADGIWCQLSGAPKPGPALFLDRDGTVIAERHYLKDPEGVELLPGAAEVIAAANARAIPVVLVTNQSGIGRGLLTWQDFAAVQERLTQLLATASARLDLVLACPFHPEAAAPYRHADHGCRKPRPGLLLRAQALLDLQLAVSWIVGDKASDLAAGRAAGLAGGLLVQSGYGKSETAAAKSLAGSDFSVRLEESMVAALKLPLFDG